MVECWYWYWQPDGDGSHGPFTPDRHTDPGPAHDTGACPSPGVKLSRAGVAATAAQTPPTEARAVYDFHAEAPAQNQVLARTRAYPCPFCKVPAGYLPVVGTGSTNDAAASCANAAGDGGAAATAPSGNVGHPFEAKNPFSATGSN